MPKFLSNLDVDASADVAGGLVVGANQAGHDVKFFGVTDAKYMLWHESSDTLKVEGLFAITGDCLLNGDVTGINTLTAATLVATDYGLVSGDIPDNAANTTGTAATVTTAAQPNITTMTGVFTGSANHLITDNGDGTVMTETQLTYDGSGLLKISTGEYNGSPTANLPTLMLENSDSSTDDCPMVQFVRRATGADNQDLGIIQWNGDNDANELNIPYASILGEISDASDGTEEGKLTLTATTTTIAGELIAKKRRFDITASGTNGDGNGDIVYFGTPAATLVAGLIYYYASTGEWTITDANTADSAKSKGLLGVAISDAMADGILLRGVITLYDVVGTETVGLPLFLSGDPGQATTTAPAANGDTVRILGYLLDGTHDMAWFNPDNTFVEVTA
jgi:hypothetical protein